VFNIGNFATAGSVERGLSIDQLPAGRMLDNSLTLGHNEFGHSSKERFQEVPTNLKRGD
jgi:hypothetical protein